jgi:hypothetical protein
MSKELKSKLHDLVVIIPSGISSLRELFLKVQNIAVDNQKDIDELINIKNTLYATLTSSQQDSWHKVNALTLSIYQHRTALIPILESIRVIDDKVYRSRLFEQKNNRAMSPLMCCAQFRKDAIIPLLLAGAKRLTEEQLDSLLPLSRERYQDNIKLWQEFQSYCKFLHTRDRGLKPRLNDQVKSLRFFCFKSLGEIEGIEKNPNYKEVLRINKAVASMADTVEFFGDTTGSLVVERKYSIQEIMNSFDDWIENRDIISQVSLSSLSVI